MSALIADNELQYRGDELIEVLVEFIKGRPVLAYRNDESSPYEPLSAAWKSLGSSDAAEELCAAVTALLIHPNPTVRSTAIHFFASAPAADANETLLHLLEEESALYSGVLDPEENGDCELRDVLTRAVGQRVRKLGKRARDVIRREAIYPGRARWAISHLGWHDAAWLFEHAIPIAVGTPPALGTLLYYFEAHNQDVGLFLSSLTKHWSLSTLTGLIEETCSDRADRYKSLVNEFEGQSQPSQTNTGSPLWGMNHGGNPDLLRMQIVLARQLPTPAEQAARLYFLGNSLADISGAYVEEGLKVLCEAAQLGSHHAAYDAALIIFQGKSADKDLIDARALLEQAVQSEAPWAAYELSVWLRQGIGGSVKTNRANTLEKLAAEKGHPQACMTRGARIANGEISGVDIDQVVALYTRAAEGGIANAAARLFLMYLNGDGINANEEKAKVWFARAEQLGFDWDTLSNS